MRLFNQFNILFNFCAEFFPRYTLSFLPINFVLLKMR